MLHRGGARWCCQHVPTSVMTGLDEGVDARLQVGVDDGRCSQQHTKR